MPPQGALGALMIATLLTFFSGRNRAIAPIGNRKSSFDLLAKQLPSPRNFFENLRCRPDPKLLQNFGKILLRFSSMLEIAAAKFADQEPFATFDDLGKK